MGILNKKGGDLPDNIVPMESKGYNAPRPIVASAERVDLKSSKEIELLALRQRVDKWQEEAWTYYDMIGEIHYSANLIADVLSRVNIYVGYNTNSSLTPSALESLEDESISQDLRKEAVSALKLLETGVGGTSGLMRNMGLNLFIAGECYLVKEPATFYKPERWQSRSVQEVVATPGTKGSSTAIRGRKDTKKEHYKQLPDDGGYLARLWRNHPQYSDESDSSLRGILDLCEQLLLLARQERVFSRSALNNGILYIADDITNLYQNDADMDPEGVNSEPEGPSIEELIMQMAQESIENENSSATVVPLILRGPKDLAEGIKHITFQRPKDDSTVEKMGRLLDRILTGLSIPKDVAGGLSNVKYSNAILIEESLYSSHIEPLILLICDQLTTVFLHPVLESYGYTKEDLQDLVVWYDPSAITAKPSKSEAANTGYQIGALSHESWRRANGFTQSDAPSELEQAKRLVIEKGLVSEAVMDRVLSIALASVFNGMGAEQLGANDPATTDAINEHLAPTVEETPPPVEPEATDIDTSDATSDFTPPEGLIE